MFTVKQNKQKIRPHQPSPVENHAAPVGGMAVRTDIRAGVGEDVTAQLQAWWQNLAANLPSLGDDSSS